MRPTIPNYCSPDIKAFLKKCWHQQPRKRPSFDDIVVFLINQLKLECPNGTSPRPTINFQRKKIEINLIEILKDDQPPPPELGTGKIESATNPLAVGSPGPLNGPSNTQGTFSNPTNSLVNSQNSLTVSSNPLPCIYIYRWIQVQHQIYFTTMTFIKQHNTIWAGSSDGDIFIFDCLVGSFPFPSLLPIPLVSFPSFPSLLLQLSSPSMRALFFRSITLTFPLSPSSSPSSLPSPPLPKFCLSFFHILFLPSILLSVFPPRRSSLPFPLSSTFEYSNTFSFGFLLLSPLLPSSLSMSSP